MPYLVLLVALAISGIAAWYSIVGLAAIFAAAKLPIIIMGASLEIGKLVTASWLYQNWKKIPILLKSYLTTAVIVLMFITSMGIFGFLSKAHIEQTAEATQNQSLIVRIEEQIKFNNQRLQELQTVDQSSNDKINEQIQKNESQIVTVNERYNVLIQEQNNLISEARKGLTQLDEYLQNDEIRKVQALVGASVDGRLGSGTSRRIEEYRQQQEAQSQGVVSQARGEIRRLREMQSQEVARLTEANQRLSSEIGTVVIDTAQIDLLQSKNTELTQQKFELETEVRKLEVEVGPIKYIAEFIYADEATPDLLEEAVRWVILIIIFVFDPLAVLLLIAANMSINENKRKLTTKKVATFTDIETPPQEEEREVDLGEENLQNMTESEIDKLIARYRANPKSQREGTFLNMKLKKIISYKEKLDSQQK